MMLPPIPDPKRFLSRCFVLVVLRLCFASIPFAHMSYASIPPGSASPIEKRGDLSDKRSR